MTSMTLSRRRFAAALPVVLAACSSPPPALYTIPMRPGPVLSKGPRRVQLRDISLAAYLDRKELVRSSEQYKLGVMANDWWGEQLSSLLSRVIVIGLSQRLPDSSVYAEGGAISADADAVIGLNIQRMDANVAGSLELLAQAAVEFDRPRRRVARTFRISKPLAATTAEGHVAAIADAIGELTDGLAEMLVS
jgi:hypothetical protein